MITKHSHYFKSYAYIRGSDRSQKPGWYYLLLDKDISLYYQYLSKQRWGLPLNRVHITFIAGEKDDRIVLQSELEPWLSTPIQFEYSNILESDGRSFWLDVRSCELDMIRRELDLSLKKFGYHITLGNNK